MGRWELVENDCKPSTLIFYLVIFLETICFVAFKLTCFFFFR